MTKHIGKSSRSSRETHKDRHRFEHWYVDNQVYFITARCRDRYPALACESAKTVFWDRFEHYTKQNEFFPWVVSVLPNHYHVLGYCRHGARFGRMMQRLHGSVAKLVNDLLPVRRTPFWAQDDVNGYFDGCIRDVLQCVRTYRYVLTQGRRHGLCEDFKAYGHTREYLPLEAALQRAVELGAFMEDIPYQRYQRKYRTRNIGHAH